MINLKGKIIPAIIFHFCALSFAIASLKIHYLYPSNGNKLRKCYFEDNHLMETTGIFCTIKKTSPFPRAGEGPGMGAEAKLDWYDYGRRFYDPVICRFTTSDPVVEFFPWMTNYQYASNNPIKNVDLDGLEGIFFAAGSPLLGTSNPLLLEAAKPTLVEGLVRASGEVGGKVIEGGTKVAKTGSQGTKGMPVEQIARGNKTECEQLAKHGLEKNTKPIREIDPKTGNEGTTIPDALKNGGQSTSEIKNVKQQSLTEQLRLQEKFSNDNGFKPELIINEGANLSKPLQNSSFDIIKYSVVPPSPTVQDNTKVASPIQIQIIQIQQENR